MNSEVSTREYTNKKENETNKKVIITPVKEESLSFRKHSAGKMDIDELNVKQY
jgi:hypothetical protein